MIQEKYLPLGTIIILKDAKKRLMIVGYEPRAEQDGKILSFDYVGCLYPEGLIGNDNNLLFNHDQIDKVFFNGYTDEESEAFKDKLKDFIDKNDSNNSQESGDSSKIYHSENVEML